MAAMGVLRVLLTALLAFSASLEVQSNGDEQYMVSAGGESPLPRPGIHAEDVAGRDDASSRRRRAVCGIPYEFSEADKQLAVDAHNHVRSLEGASDMMEMRWSDDLARRAHEWASQCQWRHGLDTWCNGASIGQNMYMSRAYPNYPIVNVTRVIENGWWAEKKYYNYTTLGCMAGQLCGHYTQVVWSNSVEVGCTIAQCPEVILPDGTPWTNAAIFVCDYNPPGNWPGQTPFTKGAACSNCESVLPDGYRCKNLLCETCDPATSADCICPEKTCVNGYFDKTLCKCVCPEGKWGSLCSKNCACTDLFGWCPNLATYCFTTQYFNWLKTNCPGTCPNTCELPPPDVC